MISLGRVVSIMWTRFHLTARCVCCTVRNHHFVPVAFHPGSIQKCHLSLEGNLFHVCRTLASSSTVTVSTSVEGTGKKSKKITAALKKGTQEMQGKIETSVTAETSDTGLRESLLRLETKLKDVSLFHEAFCDACNHIEKLIYTDEELEIIKRIMDNLCTLAENITLNDFQQYIKYFDKAFSKKLPLFSYKDKNLFNIILNFCMNNSSDITVDQQKRLIDHFFKNNHEFPQEFKTFFLERVTKDFNNFSIKHKMEAVMALCKMGVYSDEHITEIFPSGFQKNFLSYNEYTSEPKQLSLFLSLNRMVKLACPHLDIPYFGEDHGSPPKKSIQQLQKTNQLRDVLDDVLGKEFYVSNPNFGYRYYGDFEFYINSEGIPVKYYAAQCSDDPSLRRVAVYRYHILKYCLASHTLNGHTELRKNHLHKMGFKILEIPYYEWEPLPDDNSRKEYIQMKISSLQSKDL